MDRDFFFRRELRYLFSFDAPLDDGRALVESGDGRWARSGVPVERGEHAPQTHPYAATGIESPVYNALGGELELGVRGAFLFLQEGIRYPAGYEYGELTGRYVIETYDRQLIEATYSGTLRAGASWHWLANPQTHRGGRHFATVHAKAFITARHDTPSTKYRWLAQLQCVGYGRIDLVAGAPIAMTFDVYGMLTPPAPKEPPLSAVPTQR
jgi:hypothetical protein